VLLRAGVLGRRHGDDGRITLLRGLSSRQRALLGAVAGAIVLAGIGRYVGAIPRVAAFVLAAIALAGAAWIVSFSTEEVGRSYGPRVTGLLQSTLGNLPEFFVVLFALQAGHLVIAQTAILGSILSNALLVLGLVIIVGALREPDRTMRFSARLPKDTATLLLVTSLIIVLVGLANSAHDSASHHIRTISIVSAIAILIVYGTWMYQYLRSEEGGEPEVEGGSAMPTSTSLGLLIAGGVASAFVSDWFVNALEPTIHAIGISQAFAGLVIVAIAGNAVEHAVGIVLAARGQPELAISVVKNSVAQIAAFMFPVLVLASLLTTTTLTFALAPVYTGALIGTAVIIWQITGDGEATPFEGSALIAAFVILATVAAFET
jgi:Ca2+:H+ antiporter